MKFGKVSIMVVVGCLLWDFFDCVWLLVGVESVVFFGEVELVEGEMIMVVLVNDFLVLFVVLLKLFVIILEFLEVVEGEVVIGCFFD